MTQPATPALSHGSRYCCFVVGSDCFAVASIVVAEVLRDGKLTRVPHAPEAVVGLIHLRGRIVPVIDMRRRLGLPAAEASRSGTHVVLSLLDEWYSLLVDEMLDVIEVADDAIEPPSRSTSESSHDAVAGVYADADRLVHFLDPQRIVQTLARQREPFLQRQGASHGGI
jgi:purine-binding chemotaxis protein CheW